MKKRNYKKVLILMVVLFGMGTFNVQAANEP